MPDSIRGRKSPAARPLFREPFPKRLGHSDFRQPLLAKVEGHSEVGPLLRRSPDERIIRLFDV